MKRVDRDQTAEKLKLSKRTLNSEMMVLCIAFAIAKYANDECTSLEWHVLLLVLDILNVELLLVKIYGAF